MTDDAPSRPVPAQAGRWRGHLPHLARRSTGYGHLSAFITAASLYSLAAAGIIGWLALHGDTTTQRRIAQSPSITVAIAKPVTPSPGSTVPRTDDALPAANPATPPVANEDAEDAPLLPLVPAHNAPAPASVATPPVEPPVTRAPVVDATSPTASATPIPAPAITAQSVTAPVALPTAVETSRVTLPAMDVPPATGWRARSRPFNNADKRPRIGLIVTNLGLANTATRAAIQTLPAEVTLAIQTVSPSLADWADQARLSGHEVLLAVPMEPTGYPDNDPGPQTLLGSLPAAANLQRLRTALARSDKMIGIIPAQGDKFVANGAALAPVLDALQDQQLVFVDGTGNSESQAASLAATGGIPFAQSTITLDATASASAVDQALAQLEARARTNGSAIGVALPYPVTFARINDWLKTLPAKGFVLAPVSALLSNTLPAMALPTSATQQDAMPVPAAAAKSAAHKKSMRHRRVP